MTETKPQIGFVQLNNIHGTYERIGCGSCPEKCGSSHPADEKNPNEVKLRVCDLQDVERLKIVWCGAPAMDKINS